MKSIFCIEFGWVVSN